MNTLLRSEQTLSVKLNRWFFATVLSVALSGFLSVFLNFLVGESDPIVGIALWSTTSFFSCWAQIVVIRSSVRVRISRWAPWLLAASMIGWAISLLLVQPLLQVMGSIDSSGFGSAIWNGFVVGGIIGLFPGLSISLAYGWMLGPVDDAKALVVSNVIGWCLGMGAASAGIFLLLVIIFSGMSANF